MKHLNIAAVLMVRNEEKRIFYTLESIRTSVTSLIVYDTGSQDNTIAIIKEFAQKHDLEFYLLEGTFVDFETSRNLLLEFADKINSGDSSSLLVAPKMEGASRPRDLENSLYIQNKNNKFDYLLLLDSNDEYRGENSLDIELNKIITQDLKKTLPQKYDGLQPSKANHPDLSAVTIGHEASDGTNRRFAPVGAAEGGNAIPESETSSNEVSEATPPKMETPEVESASDTLPPQEEQNLKTDKRSYKSVFEPNKFVCFKLKTRKRNKKIFPRIEQKNNTDPLEITIRRQAPDNGHETPSGSTAGAAIKREAFDGTNRRFAPTNGGFAPVGAIERKALDGSTAEGGDGPCQTVNQFTLPDAFMIRQNWFIGGGRPDLNYYNIRIIKPGLGYRYKGRVHEYLVAPEVPPPNALRLVVDPPNIKTVTLPDEINLYQDRVADNDGKTKNRWKLDVEVLKRDLSEDPTNSRSQYYLAQTYECLGDDINSFTYFRLRAENATGFYEERFISMLKCGHFINKFTTSLNRVHLDENLKMLGLYDEISWYLKAYELVNHAEPLIKLAQIYRNKKQFLLAYYFSKMACKLNTPANLVLYINQKVYIHDRWQELGINAFYVNKFKIGEEACRKAIASGFDTVLNEHNLTFYTRRSSNRSTVATEGGCDGGVANEGGCDGGES